MTTTSKSWGRAKSGDSMRIQEVPEKSAFINYPDTISPEVLKTYVRENERKQFDINSGDFVGVDVWTANEVSAIYAANALPFRCIWKGVLDCNTKFGIIGPYLGLYFNSFSMEKFEDPIIAIGTESKYHLSKKLDIEDEIDIFNCSTFSPRVSRVSNKINESVYPMAENQISLSESYDAEFGSSPIRSYRFAERDSDIRPDKVIPLHDNFFRLQTSIFRNICPYTGYPNTATFFVKFKSGRIAQEESFVRNIVSHRRVASSPEVATEIVYRDILEGTGAHELAVCSAFASRNGVAVWCIRASHKFLLKELFPNIINPKALTFNLNSPFFPKEK